MTLAARNKAPATDKLATDELATDELAKHKLARAKHATDELATDELAKDELITDGLATDELATDAPPELLASKPEFVPLDDVDPPKETKSITSSPGTTTIPWWLKAFRETLT